MAETPTDNSFQHQGGFPDAPPSYEESMNAGAGVHTPNLKLLELKQMLESADLESYYDNFIEAGADSLKQLLDATDEEFQEITDAVGMASKKLHVKRLQKALQTWGTAKACMVKESNEPYPKPSAPPFHVSGNNDVHCAKLTVTGDSWAECTGTYVITTEKASKAPDKPVYKLQGQDRYIYFNPNFGAGWRIGRKIHLSGKNEGRFWYRSGIDTSEPWMVKNAEWDGGKLGPDKKIRVECEWNVSGTEWNVQRWKSNPCRHGICHGGLSPGSCFCDPDGKVDGPKIKVTGSDYYSCTGIYVLSAESSRSQCRSPDQPVYKMLGFDRFIYFYPSSNGWRIGTREALSGENEGNFWFKSNNDKAKHPWQTREWVGLPSNHKIFVEEYLSN